MKHVALIAIVASLTISTGCAHKSAIPLDNTPALIAHPQFNDAAKAAPDFTKDALARIVLLERELLLAAPFGVDAPTQK